MKTTTRRNLIDLLADAVRQTAFARENGARIGADHYRLLWSNTNPAEPLARYTMQEPPRFDELVEAVASALARFVGHDEDGVPVVYSNIELVVAQGGFDPTPLDWFTRMLLLASVRTKPERVVDLLRRWLSGAPIPRTHVIVLGGLSMQHRELAIPPNITIREIPRIRRVPEDFQYLNRTFGVPASLVAHHHAPGAVSVDGRPALFHDRAMGPAFRESAVGDLPNDVLETHPIVRFDDEYGRHILRWSLSLACNAPVHPIAGWHFTADDDIYAFCPIERADPRPQEPDFWSLQRELGYTPDHIGVLDEASLATACDLALGLERNPLGERTRLALERWIRSLPTIRPSEPPQYADLRIALERLFAPEAHRRIAARMSTRCARFLEDDPARREALTDELRAFYRTSSRFTHNPSAQQTESDIDQLQTARDTVRRSILAVIREGRADPDLQALDHG